ncbi:MAG: 50S ribosomal protein L24 [Candidatus Marinamargulisbacteria bacterium]
MANKIKKDDEVQVLTGKDKGKKGKVLSVDIKAGKLTVDGINILKKHRKKTDKGDGGIVEFPGPIDISNVAVICPVKKVPTKVGFKVLKDGKKKRVAKVSGETF